MSDKPELSETSVRHRLYADENFPLPVVIELRKLGHDVLTVQEAGLAEQKISDEEVLKYALSTQRATITHNRRDFVHLHRKSCEHGGIIICTVDRDWVALAIRIDTTIAQVKTLAEQLIRVTRPAG